MKYLPHVILPAVCCVFVSSCLQQEFEPGVSKVEFFEDASGRIEWTEIRGQASDVWGAADPARLNFGYSGATYWVRFDVEPASRERVLEVRNPHLDRLEVYFYQGDDLLRRSLAGDHLPFEAREVAHRHFVFRVPAATTEVYLQAASAGSLVLELELSSPEEFQRRSSGEVFIFGAYYGILVLMAFFYILVAFVFQRLNSIYYVLHVLTYGLFQLTLDGLGFQYVWPRSPWFENLAMLLLVPLGVISGAWFVRSFLQTRANARFMDHVLVAVVVASALTIPFAFLEGVYAPLIRVQTTLAAIFGVAALAAGIRVVRFHRPARFFLAAWCFFLVGIVGYALFVSGLAPGLFVARYGLQIGSVLEMSILSVAILERIRVYRRQREQARKEAYRHERERLRLQAELNQRLEEEVEKKTSELARALEELQRRDRIIKRELQLAHDIQRGILPPENLELKGLRFGTYHHYMTGVGGDYFDVFRISEDRVGVLMADVSGHGIPAALITVMAKISFMNVTRLYSSPLKIMQIVNRVLARTLSPLSSLSYLTAFFMTLDGEYRVSYTSAAHLPALVYRRASGTISRWEARGSILGCLPDDQTRYVEHEDRLYPGDRVLLYTDGIFESRNTAGEEFGMERVLEQFRETAQLEPAVACQRMAAAFEDFTRGAEAEDDVSFLIAEADPDCRGDLKYFGEGQD